MNRMQTAVLLSASIIIALAVTGGVILSQSAPVQSAEPVEEVHTLTPAVDASCKLDCDKIRYVPFLINPNGSERTGDNDKHAQSFRNPDGIEVIRFEDSGVDNDYRDVELDVNRTDCERIEVFLRGVRATWHHQVGVRVYYEDTLMYEEILWNDSHEGVGETKIIDLRGTETFEQFCEVPPQCQFNCDTAGLYMYIVNPDGTERHTQSEYAQVDRIGPREFYIRFEDSGSDWDFNDVMLYIDARDCRNMVTGIEHVLASWHHVIRGRITYDGEIVADIPIWEDSHTAAGQTASFDITQYVNLCPDL